MCAWRVFVAVWIKLHQSFLLFEIIAWNNFLFFIFYFFFVELRRWNIRPQNNVKRMTGNVKKQFVAKSVKCIEKFTIVVESELVLHFAYQISTKQHRFDP